MLFLVDSDRKIIFGWSGKCGCTHVKKIFYYFQNGRVDNGVHKPEEYEKKELYFDESYYICLFIRNPYERLVSGFLDKYSSKESRFVRSQWKPSLELTFQNFVHDLTRNGFQTLNIHHFTPQLSESWNDSIKNHQNLFIFDINSVPYDFLESIFEKKSLNH